MSIQIFGQNQLSGHNYWDITSRGEGKVTNYQAYDQISTDAAGRNRVSQLTTLLDGKVTNGHTPLLFEVSGTATLSTADSKIDMTVAAGEYGIIQSRRYLPYFAGKSQAIEVTFDEFHPEDNVEKRVGYFHTSGDVAPYDGVKDGFYIESSNDTISFHLEREGTDILNKDITAWSGYDELGVYQDPANWENFTVCYFDFLWLGGAILRFWLKVGDRFVLAHQFDYAGTAKNVFMMSPSQPVRVEIRSSTGTGSLRYICSQAATEGSFEESGVVRAVNSTYQPVQLSTAGTVYPIIAIRQDKEFRHVGVSLENFNIFIASATDQLLWTLQINPTFSAPLSYTSVAESSVDFALGNGTITVTSPGTILSTGHCAQNAILPVNILQNNFLAYMGGALDNTMDEYVLCATPLQGKSNVNTFASLTYKEY